MIEGVRQLSSKQGAKDKTATCLTMRDEYRYVRILYGSRYDKIPQ